MTKQEAINHMKNGGQLFRETSHDRFFYKIEDGALMCRCNELGGWHPSIEPRWETDDLQIAKYDYKTEDIGRNTKAIIIPLPFSS